MLCLASLCSLLLVRGSSTPVAIADIISAVYACKTGYDGNLLPYPKCCFPNSILLNQRMTQITLLNLSPNHFPSTCMSNNFTLHFRLHMPHSSQHPSYTHATCTHFSCSGNAGLHVHGLQVRMFVPACGGVGRLGGGLLGLAGVDGVTVPVCLPA